MHVGRHLFGRHSSSIHHLLSASYDGTIKLWDTRSKVPLHTLQAHNDKALSADWWKEDSIISGGADAQLQVFSNLRL
jgi:ribosome biogenesis protein YTM1